MDGRQPMDRDMPAEGQDSCPPLSADRFVASRKGEAQENSLEDHVLKDDWVAVIPAFNEAATIRDIAVRVLRQLRRVVVVDDGSRDGTSRALEGLPVTVLRNERNQGKAASLSRGMSYALQIGAPGIITLDGDGQHLPEEIPLLLAAAQKYPGALIVGARTGDPRLFPKSRYRANRLADRCVSIAAGQPVRDSQSGFRLYPSSVIRAVRLPSDRSRGFVFESEFLIEASRLGVRIRSVPITPVYGARPRPSHFRPLRDIGRITAMLLGKVLVPRWLIGLDQESPRRRGKDHRSHAD